jgi:hypothetical protein
MIITNAPELGIVIPLTKIDVERRLVIGVAAQEETDKSREIMDYETAKPAFEAWSKGFEAATGGLSKGNLRVMHTKQVAGRFDQLNFDDANRRVEVCAKISDDNEWKKVLDGNYTGFSIGGGYAKKWEDPMHKGVTRYTPRISEISLVDSPCMPSALFAELVKADGMTETIELHGNVQSLSFSELWKRAPAVPTFADVWADRPMTFGELAKAESRDGHGRFSNGGADYSRTATNSAIGGAGGALVGGVAGHLLGHGSGRAALMGAGVGGAVGGLSAAAGDLYDQAREHGAVHPHVEAFRAMVGKKIRSGSPEYHAVKVIHHSTLAAHHRQLANGHVFSSLFEGFSKSDNTPHTDAYAYHSNLSKSHASEAEYHQLFAGK